MRADAPARVQPLRPHLPDSILAPASLDTASSLVVLVLSTLDPKRFNESKARLADDHHEPEWRPHREERRPVGSINSAFQSQGAFTKEG